MNNYTIEQTDEFDYVIKENLVNLVVIRLTKIARKQYYRTIESFNSIMKLSSMRFPDKEVAFQSIVAIRKAYLLEIEKKQLPEDISNYIENKAISLRERTKAAVSLITDLQIEKLYLLNLCKKYGMDAAIYINDSDLGQAVSKLLETEYRENLPFFSEDCLYDLVGKDLARTILARLDNVVKLASPDKMML